jgi:rhamnose utilization protein RhaD (predicted bifunctional aldolase and dehydrogenase)
MIEEANSVRTVCPRTESELRCLQRLSARIGANPLLAQASTGNASIKLDGILWIKASGKWLADAEHHDILVPIELSRVRKCLDQDRDVAEEYVCPDRGGLRPSIETSMHAVVPRRVVVHVHSINTIAWAVQVDGREQLASRLEGLRWRWIPYVASGLPLAREIEKALSCSPATNVFILANHGLVICADDCAAAEALLDDVEARVAVEPRRAPEPAFGALGQISDALDWQLPDAGELHSLGVDAVSREIVNGGVLYPCQAIFFGPTAPILPCPNPVTDDAKHFADLAGTHSFLIVEGCGVIVNGDMTQAERAMLTGLAQIVQRIGASKKVRYLEDTELVHLLTAESDHYREAAEKYCLT